MQDMWHCEEFLIASKRTDCAEFNQIKCKSLHTNFLIYFSILPLQSHKFVAEAQISLKIESARRQLSLSPRVNHKHLVYKKTDHHLKGIKFMEGFDSLVSTQRSKGRKITIEKTIKKVTPINEWMNEWIA